MCGRCVGMLMQNVPVDMLHGNNLLFNFTALDLCHAGMLVFYPLDHGLVHCSLGILQRFSDGLPSRAPVVVPLAKLQ